MVVPVSQMEFYQILELPQKETIDQISQLPIGYECLSLNAIPCRNKTSTEKIFEK